MTAGVTAEVLELDEVSRLRVAWEDLAARALEPSIFNDPGFLLAAARHLAAPPGPRFVVVRLDQTGSEPVLVGICAVARRWAPRFMAAAAWLHPQAVAALPLLDRTHAASALEALLAQAVELPARPPAILFSGLDRDGPTATLLRASGHPVSELEERSRAVLLQNSGTSGLSAKARKELRRLRNRLAEQGAVEAGSASAPDDIAVALGRFFELERKGWKGRRGTALASRTGTRAFVREAAEAGAERGQCRIDSLLVGGQPAAMGVVFRAEDRAFYWKTAYDEDLARFSPGLQLTLQITDQQAEEPGVRLTDSCAIPGHSMIDRIWHDRIAVVDMLVATGRGKSAAFRLACTLERHRRALRARLKQMMHRVTVSGRRR